jgi:hypothetical protein
MNPLQKAKWWCKNILDARKFYCRRMIQELLSNNSNANISRFHDTREARPLQSTEVPAFYGVSFCEFVSTTLIRSHSPSQTSGAPRFATHDHSRSHDSNAAQGNAHRTSRPLRQTYSGRYSRVARGPKTKPAHFNLPETLSPPSHKKEKTIINKNKVGLSRLQASKDCHLLISNIGSTAKRLRKIKFAGQGHGGLTAPCQCLHRGGWRRGAGQDSPWRLPAGAAEGKVRPGRRRR